MMKFHEKSLEINITRELLNLADSWCWFLTDIPLWKYWRPRYRLPFMDIPKSTAAGFHMNVEGQRDATGQAGGGYDVRIKTGLGNHLLFIQFKKGELIDVSPDPQSEFNNPPCEHFVFHINSTDSNQHFLLRELSQQVGAQRGNAVVYAFPLIESMEALEANAGKLIRKTKFISVQEIEQEALRCGKTFVINQERKFRVGQANMDRCEVNFLFFLFKKKDRASDIIADVVASRFQKILSNFVQAIEKNYAAYGLHEGYIPDGLFYSFQGYLRYLLHYFEVSVDSLDNKCRLLFSEGSYRYFEEELKKYENSKRDIEIITAIFGALEPYANIINKREIGENNRKVFSNEIPVYSPSFLIPATREGFEYTFGETFSREAIEDISYLVV